MDENLKWEEISCEHIVHDEWIDFRKSDDWKFLLSAPSNATMADNYANLFVAKNCHKVSRQNLDDTEFLNVHLYTRAQIDKMIESGEFPQTSHILALLLADRN